MFNKIFKKILKFKNFFLFLGFLILWAVLLSFINLESLADKLSAGGAYVVAFFVALFGGVSVFTSSSYLATIVVLSLTDANPILLALSAGVALTLGDCLFYFFGTKGRGSLPPRIVKKLDKTANWIEDRPKPFIYFLVYIYTGFTPLPADLLMLVLSFAGYPLKRVIIPLFLGNVTLVLVIYHLVRFGVDLIGA